jgi:hypothetical protein
MTPEYHHPVIPPTPSGFGFPQAVIPDLGRRSGTPLPHPEHFIPPSPPSSSSAEHLTYIPPRPDQGIGVGAPVVIGPPPQMPMPTGPTILHVSPSRSSSSSSTGSSRTQHIHLPPHDSTCRHSSPPHNVVGLEHRPSSLRADVQQPRIVINN